jgi:hypothetical protein
MTAEIVNSSKGISGSCQNVRPYNRVVIAVDLDGKIVYSRVLIYKGGDISRYYRRIVRIENEFKNDCNDKDISCKILTGTGDSVEGFLSLFPELVSSSSR